MTTPRRRLGTLAVVVPDYDEAIAFFTTVLDFELLEDTPMGGEKRWVVVSAGDGSDLLLARASNARQAAAIGNQTGGRVFLFLETDDFARDHARYSKAGVRFLEAPRFEPYGTVAVFEDPFGNRWDLIEKKTI
jgi:catechol 2,3-dioxygenase-like lactoylglutathione lyase family enzyme